MAARGRPPVKWEDRVLQYMREIGEEIERIGACKKGTKNRNKWKLICCGNPLRVVLRKMCQQDR